MRTGKTYGTKGGANMVPSVGWFVDDEGGYTTVAMAVALLVSLTLVFSTAAVEWTMARSSEVQEVADAAALAGSNCVAAFSTVVQVVDACVLSLGLAGIMVYGVGLVVSAIPFVQAKAPAILKAGRQLLETRKDFSSSAQEGLSRFERVLPAMIMANSASCVSANCRGGMQYVGCAVPFPQTSQTDYSFLEEDVDPEDAEEQAERLRTATEEREAALKKANEAKERAWRADCVDDPLCMRSRAQTLAGLYGAENSDYVSVDQWHFEYARIRALNYYRTRAAQEAPENSSIEELTRSAAREVFYHHAEEVIAAGTCLEGESAYMYLPELPHTSQMIRESSIYTTSCWPCTQGEGVPTLHSTMSCPAATEAQTGTASLQDLENGSVSRCETCGMDVAVMGSVADASTNINNGFEHYWRIVVWSSREYAEAWEQARAAEQAMNEAADEASDAFQRAIDALDVDRPRIQPAGSWGCVSFVMRHEGVAVPAELTDAFLSGTSLPAGVAISASTLAPDDQTDGNTVLSRMFDGLKEGWGAPVELVGDVAELWGALLVGYGSAYEGVSDQFDSLAENIGSLFGERVATWIKGKVSGIVDAFNMDPADMRLRKPVLVQSQRVLDKAGLTSLGEARTLLQALPASADEIASTNWQTILGVLGSGDFALAKLPIPGSGGLSIPLTLDVSKLVGAS